MVRTATPAGVSSPSNGASSSSSAFKGKARASLLGSTANGASSDVGSALRGAPGSSSAALPARKPFGAESDDDDDAASIDLDDEGMDDAAAAGAADIAMDEADDADVLIGGAESAARSAGNVPSSSSSTSMPPPSLDPSLKPSFAPAKDTASTTAPVSQSRRIPIPPHRLAPLKKDWSKIYTPLVEMAGLQVRMNVKRKAVELRSSVHTPTTGTIQKGADFVRAYALGFDADDAIALLRIDDLFVDTFEIKDVKTLHGDHLSRAIGRIAGKDGRTRFAIENASRTRVVLADTKIHILGSFQSIKIARDAIVSLIMGSPPGKVYNKLKVIGARQRQRG